MPPKPFKATIEDSVPKVDDDIAVGEDLEFQRKWWRFETFVWTFFFLVLVADGLGLFGRGWLSKAEKQTPDGALTLHYEWVERAATPSIMSFDLGPAAVHDGAVRLFVSNSIVRDLGARRISPEPLRSEMVDGGIVYTFPGEGGRMVVQIALAPELPGEDRFQVAIPGSKPLRGKVLIVP
jgi:hypothetical protein